MRTCEYVKPNGEFCGSPAIRGRDYCHWHLTCAARRLRAEKQEATQDRTPLELPPLEDANSVQLAVMMVIDAMLHQRIGPRQSGQLLYALQIASSNLKQGVCFHPRQQTESPKPEELTCCSSYDSLEEDYNIPEQAGQLQATNHDDGCTEAAEDPDEPPAEQEELSDVQQFLRYIQGNHPAPPQVDLNDPIFQQDLGIWSQRKRERDEQHRRHWESIRHDLAEAASSADLERLKKLLARCYHSAGLQFETEGWKPAGPQKVLYSRKPPESVQQRWYEQRQANCDAEFDRLSQKEAAAK